MSLRNLSDTPPVRPNAGEETEEFGRKRILRQTFQLSASTVITQLSRFLKNLFLAGILGPASFGLWNGLQVLITYGINSHLGILQAMSREIPLSRGTGSHDLIPRLANAGFSVALSSSVAGGIIVAGIGMWYVFEEMGSAAPALLLLPVLIAQMMFLFGQALLRAHDEFGSLSRLLSVAALIEMGVTIGLVYWLGFKGIMIGLAVSHGLGAILCMRHKWHFSLHLEFDWELIRNLIRPGFPIMLTALGYYILITIDRLLLISLAGSESLGYYALGSLAIIAVRYIPMAVNQVMYPKFAVRFGATRDTGALFGYLRIPTILTAHAMGLVLGASVLILPVVTVLLPEYVPGIGAATILLAGFYFLSFTGSCANLLITINRQVEYLAFLACAIVLAATLVVIALKSNWGIVGVATVTSLTYTLYSLTFTSYTVRRYLPRGKNPFGPLLFRLLIPWLMAAVSVGIVGSVDAGNIWATVVTRVVLFGLLYAPLSAWILRREQVL